MLYEAPKCHIFIFYPLHTDVVVSLYYFSRDVLHLLSGSFADFVEDFINERLEYCPFFSQVIRFYEESKTNPNVLFVTYEKLKRDFVGETYVVLDSIHGFGYPKVWRFHMIYARLL